MKLVVFVVVTSLASAASAQNASSVPFGRPSEKVTMAGIGNEMSGEWEGATYSYMIDPDGSVLNGSVASLTPLGSLTSDGDRWTIVRDADRMTDTAKWYIHSYKTGLMLRLSRAGIVIAGCVVGSDYPNRFALVRVGKATPIAISNDCTTVGMAKLQGQLTVGGSLLVRKYEWPYDYGKEYEANATYFSRALKLFKFLVARPKEP